MLGIIPTDGQKITYAPRAVVPDASSGEAPSIVVGEEKSAFGLGGPGVVAGSASASSLGKGPTSPTDPSLNYPRVFVALHRGSSFIGRLIKWQTRTGYSHAAIVFASGEWRMANGQFCVVEAREFHGVRITEGASLDEAILRGAKDSVDLFSLRVADPRSYFDLHEFAHRQVGKGYDYTMVARFISRRGESRKSTGKWFCSELVFAAFLKAGIRLLERTEAWEVSPGMLSKSPLLKYETTI